MNKEIAKAIADTSKKMNNVEEKLDQFFNQKCDSISKSVSDSWEFDKPYSSGEYCIYQNNIWKCTIDNKYQEPSFNNVHWESTTVVTELNNIVKKIRELEDKII